jgi:hypothetical protein
MLAPDAGVARAAGGGLTMKGLGAPRAARAAEKTSGRAELIEPGTPRGRRRWVIVAVGLVLVAGGAVVLVGGVFDGGGGRSGSGENGSATSLATVTRRSLSETTQFNGALGYAGSYAVLSQAHGTVTWLPHLGAVVRDGQVVYRVDGAPVVLLYGRTPAYRALAEGAAGADVAQLNHNLVELGYVDSTDVDTAWDEFTWATRVGVEKLQNHLGVDQTGQLSLGVVVFLPTAARVTSLRSTLGGPANPQVMTATSTARTVSVALDPDLQSQVRPGGRVTITLPDGRTMPGRVTSVGKVATAPSNTSAGSGSGPTVPVQIRPTDPRATGSLDQALVEVAIIDRTARNVLAVPVDALLARAGGGYAVEVVAGDGTHHLVRVRLGLFDDAAGMVQASGPGLAAGQRVVVPGGE